MLEIFENFYHGIAHNMRPQNTTMKLFFNLPLLTCSR